MVTSSCEDKDSPPAWPSKLVVSGLLCDRRPSIVWVLREPQRLVGKFCLLLLYFGHNGQAYWLMVVVVGASLAKCTGRGRRQLASLVELSTRSSSSGRKPPVQR